MPFSPYDAATHLIGRANAVLAHVPAAPTAIRKDLCRTGVVMGIAALDTYMHRLIVHRAYDHNQLPGKLADLDLSFAYALQQADESATAKPALSPPTHARVLRSSARFATDFSARRSRAMRTCPKPSEWLGSAAIGRQSAMP